MFDYPASSLADDEGTYVQQAWAVLREGRLSPYTYTYDHVPGGWLQIAALLGLVGPRAFGSVTATARVLMLVLHVAAVVFLFLAARRLGMRTAAATLGALAFAASPLALIYVYPLYALAQGQFWPTATGAALTSNDPRAYAGSSLMDSILWQLGRPGGNLVDPFSAVHGAVLDWLHRDAALVLLGFASAIASALRWRTDPVRGAVGLLAIVSFGFLIRGGLVLEFHVPLAIPFLALNFGLGALA